MLDIMELYLAPTSVEACVFYKQVVEGYMSKPESERDAGLDLICDTAVSFPAQGNDAVKLTLGTRAAVWDSERNQFRAYMLLPRSSISKTHMRLANSVGLIDAGYRGVLMAAVDVNRRFDIHPGDRYFQLVRPDLLPWTIVHIVEEIPGGPTLRGEGGFGSTGK
jgi:dUTP pyrophosphatase